MAAVSPSQVFPTFVHLAATATAPADGVFFALSDFPALSAGDVNPTTGNFGKVMYDVMTVAESRYNALLSTAKSGRLTITRGNPTGAGSNLVNVATTCTATLDVSAAQVASEPA